MTLKEIFDKRFDNYSFKLKEFINENKQPGFITLVYKNDRVLDCRTYGFKDFEKKIPIKVDDIFRIASMTKPIVSFAILMLIDEGKISLEDPLSRFLPEAKNMKVFSDEKNEIAILNPLEREITILDLLTHTSGFIYPENYSSPIDRRYKEVFNCEFLNFDRTRENMTLEHFVSLVTKVYLAHQPGKAFTYGISTDILGYIVEFISGQKLDRFLKTNVFDKIGMKNTDFYVHKKNLTRLVPIHTENSETIFSVSNINLQRSYRDKSNFLSGGAGLTSTLSDFLKFSILLMNKGSFNGKRLIKKENFNKMINDYTTQRGIPFSWWERTGLQDEFRKAIDPYKRDIGFCLGVKKKVCNEYYKNGIFGWMGIYGTAFFFDPEKRIIGILLSQMSPNLDNFVFFKVLTYFEDSIYAVFSSI